MKIELNTSVDDLTSYFKCSIKEYTTNDFERAEIEEMNNRNRVTVLRLLSRAKRYKKQGARCI